MHLFLLAGVFLAAAFTPLYAASSGETGKKFFFLEAGAYTYNLRDRFSVPEEYKSKVSAVKGYLRLHPGFSLGKGWYFEPSFGTMLPTRNGVDGSSSAFDSHFAFQLAIPLFSFLRFRIGPGVEWCWFLSKEEAVPLNNGSSTSTSTFYTPGRSTHVFLFTATGGLSIRLHNRWSIFLDVYVPEVLSKTRRNYNASATVGFRF